MADVNTLTLTGRLVRDAELKRKGADMVICEFTIANNYAKKAGYTWSKKANFFNLAVFGKTAESLFPYLKKGALVGIDAELRQNQWEHEGKKRTSNEILVKKVDLLSAPAGKQDKSGVDEAVNPENVGPTDYEYPDDMY